MAELVRGRFSAYGVFKTLTLQYPPQILGFKAGPLEAILVIFDRRALIFWFERSWKKFNIKMTLFCAHAQG